jgi:uncharacterized surface protein with fasciclin (FAS1) repeats
LEETLAGGPFTLFCSTNTAFEALSADRKNYLISDAGAEDLTSINITTLSGELTSDDH